MPGRKMEEDSGGATRFWSALVLWRFRGAEAERTERSIQM